jgi:16S rRNA (adenine1518-N6/adenine1519-N6)-dimethyltransferase
VPLAWVVFDPRTRIALNSATRLQARKSLGQHFLADPNTARRIVRLAGVDNTSKVIEIGAGTGALTAELLATGAHVVALEVDPRCVAVLQERFAPWLRLPGSQGSPGSQEHSDLGPRFFPRNAEKGTTAPAGALVCLACDALGAPWASIAPFEEGPWWLVANLPYNIATPLVMELLEKAPHVTKMVVMVQKELAQRWCASPHSRAWAATSVRIACLARARLLGAVSRSVFRPQPHVDSALVEITRLHTPAVDPSVATYEEIAALVRIGFSERRKMLRNSLSSVVSKEMFTKAGIDPAARAEELEVKEWGRLAREVREAGISLVVPDRSLD